MQQAEIDLKVTTKILRECLNASENDIILVISDTGSHSARLATSYDQSARSFNAKIRRVVQKPQSELATANQDLISALTSLPEKNVVILVVSNKLGSLGEIGKSFRRFCQKRKHRFISTTGLASLGSEKFSTMVSAMDVDYMKMHLHGMWLKKQLDNASSVRIVTDLGTDVTIDVFGMQSINNAGNYRQYGAGGNIPAGEVYIAPRGVENVSGRVVIDGSIRTDRGGLLLADPIVMTIKHGRVVDLQGKDAHVLEDALKRVERRAKYPERVRIIGELGIGINPNAEIVGTTIVDEKVLGTAHIAIGSNYWFGGANRTIFHGDQVFKNPRVFIDGKEVKHII